jgi:hypothetical protein
VGPKKGNGGFEDLLLPVESIALFPGEAIIAEAACKEGSRADPNGPLLRAVVTNRRFLLFEEGLDRLGRRTCKPGKLLQEINVAVVRFVDSKTVYAIRNLCIPTVQVRVECADGQTVEIVTSGFGNRQLRALATVLSNRA